jgi:N6-adenosine-specific RNA methylase IME4
MKKYQLIISDPPWSLSDQLKMNENVKRGASSNYSVMSLEDLKNIPIKDIADPDGCILALWVLGSMLGEGMELMKHYGFIQKQTFVWVKIKKEKNLQKILKKNPKLNDDCLSFGMGHTFRQSHEICLIGINNTKIYKKIKNKSQRSVCFAENLGHSTKPNDLHKRLELILPDSDRIELFARRKIDGWTCIGNEVCDGEDINLSLRKLIDA